MGSSVIVNHWHLIDTPGDSEWTKVEGSCVWRTVTNACNVELNVQIGSSEHLKEDENSNWRLILLELTDNLQVEDKPSKYNFSDHE
jgi:hypothetical protein